MSKYYYIDEITKRQCGPFEPAALLSQKINRVTMVWQPGMPNWVKAEEVEELSFLFDSKVSAPHLEKMTSLDADMSIQDSQCQTFKSDSIRSQANDRSMPKNWMVESVILSVLCCSPISVVGIYYASKVENLYLYGSHDVAIRTSNLARNWALLGIMFLPLCYMIFVFITLMTR